MKDIYPVNPWEFLWDDEERWTLAGGSVSDKIPNEETLAEVRESCRHLALTNEFAINGHENRISFIVGSGHLFHVEPKPGHAVSESELARAREVLETFLEENRWYERQQEIVRRKDRDGEAFLRIFSGSDGSTRIRFVEPEEVETPAGLRDDGDTSSRFGIRTFRRDVESVVGYWIGGSFVRADEIQHRKANVDFNVRRGIPVFYPVRKNLRRAEKLLRNMSVVAEIQSAIAIIRKHNVSGRSGVENFVRAETDYTASQGNRPTYFRQYSPGTILDTSAGIDYQFPVAAIDATRYVAVLQAELRAIASRLVMPEFMLTSDASNANYSSTMIAEGPAVRMFQRLQQEMIRDDVRLMRRVLQNAAVGGVLEESTPERLVVRITPPGLSVRDRLQEVQADKILVELGAMTVPQLAARHGVQMNR
ncbi:MAG: phage portal protein [Planctomycetia bacterium]|nr:phage portal protein [Planctomycetia bacterium]